MATTASGWPYDQSSDTVYTYPARTQTLAEALESRVGYGGYKLITSASPSAASTVNINDCFSATFDHYMIVWRLSTAAGSVALRARMRVSGSDDTSSNYAAQYDYASGSFAGAAAESAQTSFYLGYVATTIGWGVTHLFTPHDAVPTLLVTSSAIAVAAPQVFTVAGGHNVSTSYTGITLYPASSTITGTIRVYGLAD